MNISQISLALGISLAACAQSFAVTVDFTSDADYDDNFVVMNASGDSTITPYTFSDGVTHVLRKTGTGTQSIIFDTSATGGSGGSGGTSGSGADTYTDVAVSATFRVSTLNSPSMSLWSRVSSDYTSGYLGYVKIVSSSSVLLRLYDSDSSALNSSVGTVLYTETIDISSTGITLDTSTFYVATFTTENTDDGYVELTISLSTTDGTTIASISYTDTTDPVLTAGQTGLRLGSTIIYTDSYTVTAIPEPSTGAFFIGGLALLLVWRLRRR